jgi:hypothetical protein
LEGILVSKASLSGSAVDLVQGCDISLVEDPLKSSGQVVPYILKHGHIQDA